MASRSLSPTMAETFAFSNQQSLEAAMQRATVNPLADLEKRLAASPQLAELGKSLARIQVAASPQLAELGKSLARIQVAASPQLAELGKSLARIQVAASPQLAELGKSLARLQGSPRSPLAEVRIHTFPHPVRRAADRFPDVISVADATITDGTRVLPLQFDLLVTDAGLREASRDLFMHGYYAEAVRKAYLYIDNIVRDKSGQVEKYGADLMLTAFSVNNPLLKLNSLRTKSERNEQSGYMHILQGVMMGIRNPRSHEYDFEDTQDEALEMLVLANHLVRKVERSSSA